MLLKIDHCSIHVISVSIFSALLTTSFLYGLVSLFVSSILLSCSSCFNSCSHVSVFIISPVSTFLYIYLICSLVKNCLMLGLSFLPCPPILESKGKNVVVPYLPFISLKNLFCNFPWGYSAYWLANEFVLLLLNSTSAAIVLNLFLL